MDRCKNCGACKECGHGGQHVGPYWYPYWSVIPPQTAAPTWPIYPITSGGDTDANYYWGTTTGGHTIS